MTANHTAKVDRLGYWPVLLFIEMKSFISILLAEPGYHADDRAHKRREATTPNNNTQVAKIATIVAAK